MAGSSDRIHPAPGTRSEAATNGGRRANYGPTPGGNFEQRLAKFTRDRLNHLELGTAWSDESEPCCHFLLGTFRVSSDILFIDTVHRGKGWDGLIEIGDEALTVPVKPADI